MAADLPPVGARIRITKDKPNSCDLYAGDICEVAKHTSWGALWVQILSGRGTPNGGTFRDAPSGTWPVNHGQFEVVASRPPIGSTVRILRDKPSNAALYWGDLGRVVAHGSGPNTIRVEFVSGRGEAPSFAGGWYVQYGDVEVVEGISPPPRQVAQSSAGFDLAELIGGL